MPLLKTPYVRSHPSVDSLRIGGLRYLVRTKDLDRLSVGQLIMPGLMGGGDDEIDPDTDKPAIIGEIVGVGAGIFDTREQLQVKPAYAKGQLCVFDLHYALCFDFLRSSDCDDLWWVVPENAIYAVVDPEVDDLQLDQVYEVYARGERPAVPGVVGIDGNGPALEVG